MLYGKAEQIKFISYCELSEPSMKEIDGEKKMEWKKDVIKDTIKVSDAEEGQSLSTRIISLSKLPLHYSNKSNLKISSNSVIHNGQYGIIESIIIDRALVSVCLFSLL